MVALLRDRSCQSVGRLLLCCEDLCPWVGTMRYGECVGILGILQLDVELAAAAAVVVLKCFYHTMLPRQHR